MQRHARAPAIRHLLRFAATLGLAIVLPAQAATFDLRHIQLADFPGFFQQINGTVETRDGTAEITDWHVNVTSREVLGHFTSDNTVNRSQGPLLVETTASGLQLRIAASVDGFSDGSSLSFGSARPGLEFAVTPADFTGDNIAGGAAFFVARGNFDALPFGEPDGSLRPVASSSAARPHAFELVPLTFAGGAVMRGWIYTRGKTGMITAADIAGWNIYVEQITEDTFDASNSRALARGLGLTPTGDALTVDNIDGLLTFSKGSYGGHPYAVQIADFTDGSPRGGQAGYYQGALSATTIALHSQGTSPWRITGDGAIGMPFPAPGSAALFAVGLAGLLLRQLRAFTPA